MKKFLDGLYRIAFACAIAQNPLAVQALGFDTVRDILEGKKEV